MTAALLPVDYFHVVFTLPGAFNSLALSNLGMSEPPSTQEDTKIVLNRRARRLGQRCLRPSFDRTPP
jgi:hypothetical protein